MATHSSLGRPSAARMYDYYLGGTHNTDADRALAEQVIAAVPAMPEIARANRAFLRRAVEWLVGEQGISRFLDLGSGLPTVGSVHDTARCRGADPRVVYVDLDPVAAEYGRRLFGDDPATQMIHADLRAAEDVLTHPAVAALLEAGEPVGLLMVAVLQFLPDADRPLLLLERYRSALPAGSWLVLSHPVVSAGSQPADVAAVQRLYEQTQTPATQARTREEVQALFGGWQVTLPGIVWVDQWRPWPPGAAPAVGERPEGWSRVVAGVAEREPVRLDRPLLPLT